MTSGYQQWGFDAYSLIVIVVVVLLVLRWRLMRKVRFRRRLEWQSIERKLGEASGYFIRTKSRWGVLTKYRPETSSEGTPMEQGWILDRSWRDREGDDHG